MNPPFRATSIGILLLAAVLVGSTSLMYPSTALDLPTSIYIGRTILHGGVPYRDAWDLRAPGIYFVFAFEQFCFGKSMVGVRVFELLWQFLTAVILAWIGQRLWRSQVVGCLAGLLYLLLYFSENHWSWAEPDGLLSLPLALALLLAQKGRESSRFYHWTLSGALVGAAALFKLSYGLFGIGLAFAAVQLPTRRRAIVSRWLALAVGLGITFGLCGLYFYLKDGLRDLLLTQFVFAPHYLRRVHAVITLHDLRQNALQAGLFPLYVLAGIGLARWVFSCVFRRRSRTEESLVFTWLAVAGLTLFVHGSYLGYHLLPFLAPSAILAAPLVHLVYSGFRQKTRLVQATLMVAAAIFLLMPLKRLGQHAGDTWRSLTQTERQDSPGRATARFPVFPSPRALRELILYIKQNTSPADRIFVWGSVPTIYLRTDRQAASRFLCTAYLSIDTPEVHYRRTLLEELQRNRPVFFLLIKNGPITPGLSDAVESFEQFSELKSFVQAEFQVEDEHGWYTVFRRRVDR